MSDLEFEAEKRWENDPGSFPISFGSGGWLLPEGASVGPVPGQSLSDQIKRNPILLNISSRINSKKNSCRRYATVAIDLAKIITRIWKISEKTLNTFIRDMYCLSNDLRVG